MLFITFFNVNGFSFGLYLHFISLGQSTFPAIYYPNKTQIKINPKIARIIIE
jgi:hypothetical protein